jgi:hypothetical protein
MFRPPKSDLFLHLVTRFLLSRGVVLTILFRYLKFLYFVILYIGCSFLIFLYCTDDLEVNIQLLRFSLYQCHDSSFLKAHVSVLYINVTKLLCVVLQPTNVRDCICSTGCLFIVFLHNTSSFPYSATCYVPYESTDYNSE